MINTTLKVLLNISTVTIVIFGGIMIISNWRTMIRQFAKKKNAGSYIPLFGGMLVSAGLWMSTFKIPILIVLLPIIIDVGCLPVLLMTVVGIIIKGKK